MSAHDAYVAGLLEHAAAELGRSLPVGTCVVPEAERAGSSSASVYPLPLADRTIIWVDPALVERLDGLNSADAISTDTFLARARELGGTVVGEGNNRVLVDNADLVEPVGAESIGLVPQMLDADVADDRARIEVLAAACSDDDLDEADLDLEQLDPHILGLVAADGAVAAYASARPSEYNPTFDDIGVLTHPEFRGRRLGARAVYEYITMRQTSGCRFLYRCTIENIASNKLSDSIGFTLVQRIAATTFGDQPE